MSPPPRNNPLAAGECNAPRDGNIAAPPPDATLLLLIHRVSSAGRALRRLLAEQSTAIGLNEGELLVVWLCAGGPKLRRSPTLRVGQAVSDGAGNSSPDSADRTPSEPLAHTECGPTYGGMI